MARKGDTEGAIQSRVLVLTPSVSDAISSDVVTILRNSPDISVEVVNICPRLQTVDAAVNSIATGIRTDPIDLAVIVELRNQSLVRGGVISAFRKRGLGMPVMIIGEVLEPDDVMDYFRLGISDYISPPVRAVDLLPRLWRLVEYGKERACLTYQLKNEIALRKLVGESPSFVEAMDKMRAVAPCDVGVLISGETGTGKELCARAIHYLGPRAGKPFIPVNCGTIPNDLVENELFGHARGAFTGAIGSQEGLIQSSVGGTLFLDEIDCLPLPAQAKFLRFLQEREYRRIGSPRVYQADVRIIAATNTDLEESVREGKFRADLYYRLNIVRLRLPPLRERIGDIPILAGHFLAEAAAELDRQVSGYSPEAMHKLATYDWPGNIRELQNIVKRTVLFCRGRTIQQDDIELPALRASTPKASFRAEKAKVVAEFESRYMRALLKACNGNITRAAQAAGKNRRAFWELMRKHKIGGTGFSSKSP